MELNLIDLGARIRQCRQTAGMTQGELAKEAGVSTSFIGHIERGSRVSSVDTLVNIANALNVSTDYLLAASLNANYEKDMPLGLSDREREQLSKFIKLAQDTICRIED